MATSKKKVKDSKLIAVLSSNLRLLVLLRESLAANGDADSPLYSAIKHQANVTGLLLPDHERMTPEELDALRRQAQGAMSAPEAARQHETERKLEDMARALPSGGMMVLNPETMRPR